jgi:transcriptional regulator of aromatic amino acid metabolism
MKVSHFLMVSRDVLFLRNVNCLETPTLRLEGEDNPTLTGVFLEEAQQELRVSQLRLCSGRVDCLCVWRNIRW